MKNVHVIAKLLQIGHEVLCLYAYIHEYAYRTDRDIYYVYEMAPLVRSFQIGLYRLHFIDRTMNNLVLYRESVLGFCVLLFYLCFYNFIYILYEINAQSGQPCR